MKVRCSCLWIFLLVAVFIPIQASFAEQANTYNEKEMYKLSADLPKLKELGRELDQDKEYTLKKGSEIIITEYEKSSSGDRVFFRIKYLVTGDGDNYVKNEGGIYIFPISVKPENCLARMKGPVSALPGWEMNVQIGQSMSTLNTASGGARVSDDSSDTDTTVPNLHSFGSAKTFVGISAKQIFGGTAKDWGRLSVMEDVRFGATANVDQPKALPSAGEDVISFVSDADVIDTQFSLKYDLKWWTFIYVKAMGGFLVANDSRVKDDFLSKSFLGIGFQVERPESRYYGSFLEIGSGSSERFDKHEFPRLKSEAMIYYKLGETAEILKDWKAFVNMRIDSGSKADDLQVSYGVQRSADFVFNALGGLFENVIKGKAGTNETVEATSTED